MNGITIHAIADRITFMEIHCHWLEKYGQLNFKTMCPSVLRVSAERFFFRALTKPQWVTKLNLHF